MNQRIKKIYVILSDNNLLFFSTTLKDLHTKFDKAKPGLISYITLYRAFTAAYCDLNINLGGIDYHFQVKDAS